MHPFKVQSTQYLLHRPQPHICCNIPIYRRLFGLCNQHPSSSSWAIFQPNTIVMLLSTLLLLPALAVANPVVGRSAPPLSTVTSSQTNTGTIIQSSSSTVDKAAASSTIVAKASSATKLASSVSVANQSPSQCRAGSRILNGRTCTVICGQDRQGGDYDRT